VTTTPLVLSLSKDERSGSWFDTLTTSDVHRISHALPCCVPRTTPSSVKPQRKAPSLHESQESHESHETHETKYLFLAFRVFRAFRGVLTRTRRLLRSEREITGLPRRPPSAARRGPRGTSPHRGPAPPCIRPDR